MKNNKIGIVGLGKLGLPMLAAFISKGFDAIGYDINTNLINRLSNQKNPYFEKGVDEIIDVDDKWKKRFFTNLKKFTKDLEHFFFIVPTPSENDIFNIQYLRSALINTAKELKDSSKQIIFIITSTVNPGDTEILEKEIKEYNKNINLIYSPEFIALGSVFSDMLNPDIVLLGGNDESSLDKVFNIYSKLYNSYPEFHRLNFFEAEVSKIAVNSFVTMKISFANMIGTFVDLKSKSRLSAQKALNAIGGDSRIGRKYFKYGVSYGGPCFPRDNKALSFHIKSHGLSSDLPLATDKINNEILNLWKKKILLQKYDAVILLGLAYKQGTDYQGESFMIDLGNKLIHKVDIYYHDKNINYPKFQSIEPSKIKKLLKKYNKLLLFKNYGQFNFENSPKIDVVEIWN